MVNAGTAIAALRAAAPAIGEIPPAATEAGLVRVEWPGRMQRLARGRLAELVPAGSELWLDGGHNGDGGRAVASAVADLEERAPAPLVLVVAMLSGKDAAAFLRPFVGLARELIAVPMTGQATARPPSDLAGIAASLGMRASVAPSLEGALRGVGRGGEKPPRILICGSLYLAGEVLAANGTPPS